MKTLKRPNWLFLHCGLISDMMKSKESKEIGEVKMGTTPKFSKMKANTKTKTQRQRQNQRIEKTQHVQYFCKAEDQIWPFRQETFPKHLKIFLKNLQEILEKSSINLWKIFVNSSRNFWKIFTKFDPSMSAYGSYESLRPIFSVTPV